MITTQDVRKMSPAVRKKKLAEELLLCREDVVYFVENYCYVEDKNAKNNTGKSLFTLYPYQLKILNILKGGNDFITVKGRQLGLSTVISAQALHMMLFFGNKTILALATDTKAAGNLVKKVRHMYDNLPKWMQLSAVEKNKQSLTLSNGSRVTARSSKPDAARSEAVSLLILDEAAFIENVEEVYTAASPTLASGGQCAIISTPNGTGNWFHNMWVKAGSGDNDFIPVRLPWSVHPDRNEEWAKKEIRKGTQDKFDQEYNCSFLASGTSVFDINMLKIMEKDFSMDPKETRGVRKSLWVWKHVERNAEYIISADVARGDSSDFSAFHVFNIQSMEQVAEYKDKISPREFGQLLVAIATEYNNATLVIENANIGYATIEEVQYRNYKNLYYGAKGNVHNVGLYSQYVDENQLTPGFTMSVRTRPLVISRAVDYVRDKEVVIRSRRLLDEMSVFVWKNGKAQSQIGFNDDLVISFAILTFVRDTSLNMLKRSKDLNKACLTGFSVVTGDNSNSIQNSTTTPDWGWLTK